ncbi:MAG: MarR family transcriptional regulator [Chloroflexi bacterium]|nr:MarR family transcriptional regulator [Chloroflexota bacterium]
MSSDSETVDLARRFLRVLEVLGRLTHYRMPDDLAGQLAVSHFKALHILLHRPGMAQKELADYMGLTPAAISTAVQNMESLGLIERRRPQEEGADSRVVRLFLSEKAESLIRESQTRRCEAAAGLLNALPPDEQRMIVEALERAMRAKESEGGFHF